ncbi:MAG: DUF4230 domain-containing protein [Flexilinea sp.]|nr:DUF4230 domain-containing protein [Flexilinea sp.]
MSDSNEIKVSDRASISRTNKICLICALVLVVIAAAACFLAFINGSRAVKQAFDREREAAEESVYHSFYEQGFKAGEEEYHVKNRAVITLGNIRETANLEVLSVSDIAFMIEDPSSENKNIQSWIQVPGTGVYTVDLAAGEFLVDDERSMVFVRIPKPELLPMNISIDHANIEILRFESNVWKSSVRDGEQLAGKQLNEARTRIQEDISSNLQYYEFAEKSARSLLENLIRAVNSEIPDLKVEIEFF